MADNNKQSGSSDTIGNAINRVLRTEREAGQAIAVCEDEARELLAAAQQQVQRISVRTDKRITMCHMRAAASTTRKIGELEKAETAAPPDESARQPNTAVLAEIAAAVVKELTIQRPPSERDDQL